MDCFCLLLTRLHQADWRVKKKKKLGDDIELVENLRVNKRHLVGWKNLIKIHKFHKEGMIPGAITENTSKREK